MTTPLMAVDDHATADERRRTRRFFNLVAPAFHVIDRRLYPEYRRALEDLGLPAEMSILDVGTGTGTLARAFVERGHRVTGVDFAARLLRKARHRAPTAEFLTMDLVDLDAFESGSFDVVTLAYVLHGFDPQLRSLTLSHAARLARFGVLIFDYSGMGPWYVRLIEWIEGPHYPAFVSRPMAEHLQPFGL
ncbi:MAG: class I SAM-dependent methyltransferase, partial [Thermoanaerobaculales bacterium]|nr:class I SAM-dependent methyltransferase [Thermoanaerobaculales bacterium]